MPISALLPFVPAAIQGVKTLYTALNKPKRTEPTELLSALDRTIANNESDIVSKTLLNQTTSAAKSLGARTYQRARRSIGQMGERGDLSQGQEARALLTAGTEIQGQVGEQTENALLQQTQQNLSQQQMVDQARLKIAELKDQARARYSEENLMWRNEIVGGLLDTAVSGFNTYMQKQADEGLRTTVNSFLNGRNITDLDEAGLNGLLATLTAYRLGLGGK